MIKNGADVNIPNHRENTALIFTSCSGKLEVIKLLLKNGADLSLQNEDGSTAFSLASKCGNLEVVKLLTRGTEMEEWRPWHHSNFSVPYRNAMSTLLLLAKS